MKAAGVTEKISCSRGVFAVMWEGVGAGAA